MTATQLHVDLAGAARTIQCRGAGTLVDELRLAATPLNARCGQRGLCDGCMVQLRQGTFIRVGSDAQETAADQPVRACQYAPTGDTATIHVPARSLLAYQPQVVVDFRVNVSRVNDPLWQQCEVAGATDERQIVEEVTARREPRWPVRVSPETLETPDESTPEGSRTVATGEAQSRSDEAQPVENVSLEKEPRRGEGSFATLQRRRDHWLITALTNHPETAPLGAAIDIGTTTVAVLLVELSTGHVVGKSAQFNRQMQLGDDVLTRIQLCCTDEKWVGELQKAVVEGTIAPLLRQALSAANADPDRLKCCAIAANTTMLHLLAGENPASMGTVPFTPVFLDHRVIEAGSIECWPRDLAPKCSLHLLPGPAAYVGADLSAGVLATGMIYDQGPCLLVDVGTNGEIILKHHGKLTGCATAAGPAFEGAGLSSGIRAGEGAIGHIRLGDDGYTVQLDVIGRHDQRPIGICGSGYIDFLGEGRRVGLLSEFGRFDKQSPWSDHFVQTNGSGLGFVLAGAKDDKSILVSESDIASLLAAKGAIAAGVLTLLERQGLTQKDVQRVYLAGGFGTHMSAPNAIACGLLPGFTIEQIQPVGNSALAGAYLALLDSTALDEIARACVGMEIVELNTDPGFEGRYIEQMMLP